MNQNDAFARVTAPLFSGAGDHAVNTTVLNKILWRDRKGDLPMPSAMHTVLPQSKQQDND